MSKTKDEILLDKIGPSFPSVREYLKLASPPRAEAKIHEAMDEWGQQKLDEFKEKLKARMESHMYQLAYDDYRHGFNVALNKAIIIIEE